MKLRKRKPIEKQVEILDHSDEETKDISVSFSNEEERPSNKILGGNKRIKLEEAKMVLDETVKSEDEGGGLKLYKENSNGEKVNKGVRIKVSQIKDGSNVKQQVPVEGMSRLNLLTTFYMYLMLP